MPFDALTKLLGITPNDPDAEAKLAEYKANQQLAMQDSGAASMDRIKMGQTGPLGGEHRTNDEIQGPLMSMTASTPAEKAQAANAMSFATMGSLSSGRSAADALRNAEGMGLARTAPFAEQAAPAGEKGLGQLIKELAAKRAARMSSQGQGGLEEAQNVGKLSEFLKKK